jgi:hypothetical protein
LLYDAALLALCDGDYEAAAPFGAELLERATAARDEASMGRAHHVLADLALVRGQADAARGHYETALALPGERPTSHAVLRRSLGEVALLEGDPHAGEAFFREALVELQRLGDPFEIGRTCVALGWQLAVRAAAESIDVLRDAWRIGEREGYFGIATAALQGLGVLCVARGLVESGVRARAAAEVYAHRHGVTLEGALVDYAALPELHEAFLQRARDELGDAGFDAEATAGRSIGADDDPFESVAALVRPVSA